VPDISVYLGQIDRDSKTDTWLNVAITHYKAHLGVPLVVRDRVYGALVVSPINS
jgi:GAF domain-containing protein